MVWKSKTTGQLNDMSNYNAEVDGLEKIEQYSKDDIYDKYIKIHETYFGARKRVRS